MQANDIRGKVPVSVIIPCYNCSETIELAMDSIILQTALPEEVFLVDDASPDEGQTIERLYSLKRCYGDLLRIEIIELKKNEGPAFARNTGWDAASQPYIALLDADDVWHPQKLELIYNIIKKNPTMDLIGHDFYLKGRAEGVSKTISDCSYEIVKKGFYSILLLNPFVTPSFFFKKSISERFDVNLRYCEDHEFLLRVSRFYNVYHAKLRLVQLGKEPFTGGGLTARRTNMRLGEISMYFRALKYSRSLIFMIPLLIIFSVVKHSIILVLTQFKVRISS